MQTDQILKYINVQSYNSHLCLRIIQDDDKLAH